MDGATQQPSFHHVWGVAMVDGQWIDMDATVKEFKLGQFAPFPVYGLQGRPMGLRLKNPGWGGKGSPMVIDSIHLGYVAGHPSRPEKAVDITQGPAVDSGMDELGAIRSLVHNYVSEERQEPGLDTEECFETGGS